MVLLALLLAGCALPYPERPQAQKPNVWSGRMALVVEGDAGQSFSAMFVLEGTPARGDLTLSTPLGTVLAALHWAPGNAAIQSPNGNRTADSLDALLTETFGSALPVEALFAWLHGEEVAVAGWQADLIQIGTGRLTAVRSQPLPRASLRIALDR
ncbi:MAG: lipoprotein insertase outer membrane protein LolB [Giesbergeria sp.]